MTASGSKVYLLIQAEVGLTAEAAGILRALARGGEVEFVHGPFDFIVSVADARAEAEILFRCEWTPFIRALPCRVRADTTEHRRRPPS